MVNQIDDINMLIDCGHNWRVVHSAIEELIEIAERYMAVEAALMQLFALPAYEEHEELHQMFCCKLSSVYAESLNGGDIIGSLGHLKEWLIDHVSEADRRDYGDFILAVERRVKDDQSTFDSILLN